MKTKLTLLTITLFTTAAFAGGSKAPGTGSFRSMSNVRANSQVMLIKDTKKGEQAPLGLPQRVAFTQIKNSGTWSSAMIIRNSDGNNFKFNLPSNVSAGDMKQPVAPNLSSEGDVLRVSVSQTGQALGLRLSLTDKDSDSNTYDTTESCTITRERRIKERHCWKDEDGRKRCKDRWITKTVYIDGYRDVTKTVYSESASYHIKLLDRGGNTQMSSDITYSDSSTYTNSRSECFRN